MFRIFYLTNHNLSLSPNEIEKEMVEASLFAWPRERPERCAMASVAFSEVADQVAAIAAAMAHGKCYEKHSKLIGELSQISQGLPREVVDHIPRIKNGALIELEKPMSITIANTQIQSMQNQNSLISGLGVLSKDKDCLELLKGNDQLSTVGKTLSTVGAISMLIPSPLGLAGSAALITSGGAMNVLHRMLTPAFNWNRANERREFMSLTCAFYNLRSQLIAADFFTRPSPTDAPRIEKARNLLIRLDRVRSETEQGFRKTKAKWNQAQADYLKPHLKSSQTKLFQSAVILLHILESPDAEGKVQSKNHSGPRCAAKGDILMRQLSAKARSREFARFLIPGIISPISIFWQCLNKPGILHMFEPYSSI